MTSQIVSYILVAASLALCVTSSGLENWCVGDVTDSYQSAMTYTNSSVIGRQQLQTIIDDVFSRAGCHVLEQTSGVNMSCSGCLTSDNVLNVLKLPSNANLNREQFYEASTIITTYIYQLTNSCAVGNQVDWVRLTYEDFVDQLKAVPDVTGSEHAAGNSSYMSEAQLESLLRMVSVNYVPGQNTSATDFSTRLEDTEMTCSFDNIKSFSSAQVLQATGLETPDAGIHDDELGRMSSLVIAKLVAGECIVRVYEHTPVSSDFVQSIYNIYSDDPTSCRLTVQGLERLMTDLGITLPHEDVHSATDSAGSSSSGLVADQKRRRRRSAEDVVGPATNSEVVDVNKTCSTAEDLLKSFGISESSGITRTDFHSLCPALVQQVTAGCKYVATSTTTKPSAAEIYGYGTLSVFVVSIVSLLGLVVVKFRHMAVYKYLLVFMLGLAVGSLVGDCFLHLIPQALGLHDHAGETTHEEHTGIYVEPYVWKMLCACLSVWLFFILQLSLQWIGNVVTARKEESKEIEANGGVTNVSVKPNNNSYETTVDCHNHSDNELACVTTFGSRRTSSVKSIDSTTDTTTDVESTHVHAHPSVAWMVTVGDAIHNFADGLAIGASYEISWGTGLSTTIAVFCHELPHEFGDVAILLSTGWSPLKVGIFQLISASTAFVGLYVGISISEVSDDAQQWIFIVASGMFLYVALADVVPELVEYFTRYRPLPIFLVSNCGIMLGFLAMMLLAVFEEQITIGE